MSAASTPSEPDFHGKQISAVVIIGVISSLVPALQPLLLGQLAAEARISLVQIGQAAMLEAFGMALSVSLAGAFLKPKRLRIIASFSAIIAVAFNLLTPHLQGPAVLGARFLTGGSAGLLLWIWLGLLARSAMPARLMAIFITASSSSLLLLSSLFSALLLGWGGASAGYGVLAALSALTFVLIPLIPALYPSLGHSEGFSLLSARALAGLGALFLHLAAIMALWVYVVPLAQQAGLSAHLAGLTVSFALALQVLAGPVAGIIAPRVNATAMLLLCVVASLLAIAGIGMATSAPLFIACVMIFGFFWMFAPSFHVPYIIMVDPTRRAALQIITAQFLGISAGPALASLVVNNQDAGNALWVSAAMFVVAGLIFAGTSFKGRRSEAGQQ